MQEIIVPQVRPNPAGKFYMWQVVYPDPQGTVTIEDYETEDGAKGRLSRIIALDQLRKKQAANNAYGKFAQSPNSNA